MSQEEHKIVLLGGGGSGKTALALRFVTNNFVKEYDPTIEDSYKKSATIDEKACLLDILDTAGQEEFSSMQDQWIREGEAFLIVYSITSKLTLDHVIILREKILRVKEEIQPPIVLVGSKLDLQHQREVTVTEGRQLAYEWDASFFEASAKDNVNVNAIFFEAVRMLRRQNIGNTVDKKNARDPQIGRKMSILCGAYYYKMQQYDYYDEHNKGAMDHYLEKNNFFEIVPNDNVLMKESEESGMIDIHFPMDKNEIDKFSQYKKIYAINNAMHQMIMTGKCDVFYINWPKRKNKCLAVLEKAHVMRLIYLHFYPKMSQRLQQIIDTIEQFDVNDHRFASILRQLQNKSDLTNDQLKLLHQIINDSKFYRPIYDSFSMSFSLFRSQRWNEKHDERLLWEIYSVHKTFRNHNNPTINYNIYHFCREYLKVNYPEKLQLYLLINRTINAQ
eukprot:312958_1